MATENVVVKFRADGVRQVERGLQVVAKTASEGGRSIADLERTLRRLARVQGRQARREMEKLSESFRTAGRTAKTAAMETKKLNTGLDGLINRAAALATGGAILGVAVEFENLERRIAAVSENSEDAAKNFDLIRKISDDTGTSLSTNAATFARLSIATQSLGVNSQRTAGILNTINKAFSIQGISASEARSAVTQLAQGLASDRLQGDELRSLLENAPLLAQELSKNLGVTIGQLRKLGAEGKLSAATLIDALEASAGSIDARFANLGVTFEQSIQRLKNAVLELGTALQPVLENLTTSAQALTEFIKAGGSIQNAVAGQVDRSNQNAIAQGGSESRNFRERTSILAGLSGRDAEELRVAFKDAELRAEELSELIRRIDQGLDASIVLEAVESRTQAINLINDGAIKSIIDSDDTSNFAELLRLAEGNRDKLIREVQNLIAGSDNPLNPEGQAESLLARSLVGTEAEIAAARTTAKEQVNQFGADLTALLGGFGTGFVSALNGAAKSVEELAKETEVGLRVSGEQLKLRKALLDEINGPQERHIQQVRILSQLLAEGAINQTQFNTALGELPAKLTEPDSALDGFIGKFQKLDTSAKSVGESFANALVGGVGQASNALAEFAASGGQNVESLKASFAQLFQDLTQQILQIIIQTLVLRAIQGSIGGSVFGSTGPAGGGLDDPSEFIGFAAGGPVSGNNPILVGERGPEIFTPTQGGNITPNSQTQGGSQMPAITIVNQFDEDMILSSLDSRAGQEVILNVIQKNRRAIDN